VRSRTLVLGAAAALLGLVLSLAVTHHANARVLMVGPGRRYTAPCQAITAARPGDQIRIDARGNRSYRGDVCAWSTNRLTIVGVDGRAHIDAADHNSGGKATWVIGGRDTRIENVEFSGAHVPDLNGAGIRQEGANLTLEHCYFHDNQEGILAGDNPASTIVIDSSVFARNGAGDGYSHNIYINHIRSFTLRYSYSTDARVGHLVKSRALRNYILYDRLSGERGSDSYELDLPNGGLSYVIGTVIQQGPTTRASNMLAYGEEGNVNPGSRLYAVNDTFINDLRRGYSIFVGSSVAHPVTAENDITVGSSAFVSQPAARLGDDCVTSHPMFIDPARYDYRLRRSSPCRGVGKRLGTANGYSLVPRFQYAHVASHTKRTDGGTIAGAYGS
jgi:hypothetical protein